MNSKVVRNFIDRDQQASILEYLRDVKEVEPSANQNIHVKIANDYTKGLSLICDLTKTEISKTISDFQGGGRNVDEVPEVFIDLKDKIAEDMGITKDHVFLQILDMKRGGQIKPHYDAGVPGYITYKCNICALGHDDYIINIDDTAAIITEKTLYTFEANFYKHWVDAYDKRRVLLSYGFMLPNQELGYGPDHPRVRLFNRLWKQYMNDKAA